jgi:transcriptional regulator with XRE-family HTH domain
MKLSEAISKRIIMLCRDRGISIEQLAEKANADPNAVMAVIKGHGHIAPLDLMGEICLTLGVTMSDFFHHSLFEGF